MKKLFMLRGITAALVLMLLGAASVLADDVTTGSLDKYKLIVPDLVRQGETFTGRVVEATPAGDAPLEGGQVFFQGQVIPIEPGGRITLPAFTKEAGSAAVVLEVMRAAAGNAATTLSRQVEVLTAASNLPVRLAQASTIVNPGGEVWGMGQGLNVVKAALLDQNGGEHALHNVVGSSLQVRGTAPDNLAPGTYRFVAWDAAGNRVEAPNTSKCPTLKLEGSRITHRGQRGTITVLSDTDGTVLLSGGEPQIVLDERTVSVGDGRPGRVNFVGQQVGDYKVKARLFTLDGAVPAGDLRVDTRLEPLQSRYDAASRQTQATAGVGVVDDAGRPVANAPVYIALAHPNGVEYGRVVTNQEGQASFTQTLAGQLTTESLSALVFRVPGYRWQQDDEKCHCVKVIADMVAERSDSTGKHNYPDVSFKTGKNKEGDATVTITAKVGVHWTLFCEPGKAPGGCKAGLKLKAVPQFGGLKAAEDKDGSVVEHPCQGWCPDSPVEGHPELIYKVTLEKAELPLKGTLTLTLESTCEKQTQQQWKMILAIDSEKGGYNYRDSSFNGDGKTNADHFDKPEDMWKRPPEPQPKPARPPR